MTGAHTDALIDEMVDRITWLAGLIIDESDRDRQIALAGRIHGLCIAIDIVRNL